MKTSNDAEDVCKTMIRRENLGRSYIMSYSEKGRDFNSFYALLLREH